MLICDCFMNLLELVWITNFEIRLLWINLIPSETPHSSAIIGLHLLKDLMNHAIHPTLLSMVIPQLPALRFFRYCSICVEGHLVRFRGVPANVSYNIDCDISFLWQMHTEIVMLYSILDILGQVVRHDVIIYKYFFCFSNTIIHDIFTTINILILSRTRKGVHPGYICEVTMSIMKTSTLPPQFLITVGKGENVIDLIPSNNILLFLKQYNMRHIPQFLLITEGNIHLFTVDFVNNRVV